MTGFTRPRAAVFFSLAAVMIAVGIIVWWRFPGSTLTAQERMEDLCASVVYPSSFDMIDRATFSGGGGDGVAEYDVRGNGRDRHMMISLDGNLSHEAILVYPKGGDSSDSERSAMSNVGSAYVREYSSGEWGDWDVTVGESAAVGGTASSSARTEAESFCGLVLEIPGYEVEFRYVGQETIDGVSTQHYFHFVLPSGWPRRLHLDGVLVGLDRHAQADPMDLVYPGQYRVR